MSIKNKLRTWLDIKDPIIPEPPKDWSKDIEKLTEIVSRIRKVECYVCHKALLADNMAIYSDNKGHKFCSHECIDKLAGSKK